MEFDLQSYDPADPEAQQDPFPHYAALRQQAPVFRHPKTGVYFVSRYDTVRDVLANPAVYSSRLSNAATMPSKPEILKELARIASRGWLPPKPTLVTADPPVHTPYRKATAPLLSPRRVKAMEPWIRDVASQLVGAWPRRGRIDFRKRFALPLPVRVVARLLGMKPGLESDIDRWAEDSTVAIGADVSDERRLEAMRGIVEMQHQLKAEIDKRREHPGDDFVTQLLATKLHIPGEAPRELDLEELLSVLVQALVAGKEATTKGFCEIIKLLAEHPDEWQRVRSEPDRIPLIVEEGLRLASPNQGLYRTAVEDSVLDGVEVPAGSTLWVMFGSANRDESRFPEPDRFDPDRPNLREHLAFGIGAHFCVGAPLARAELRLGLEEIAERVGTLRIPADADLSYDPSFILRGLKSLELEVDAG